MVSFKSLAIAFLLTGCAVVTPMQVQQSMTPREQALDILHQARDQKRTITGHFAGDARLFGSHWDWDDLAPERIEDWQAYDTMWDQFIVSLSDEVGEFPGLIEIKFTETRQGDRADLDEFIPFIEQEVWERGALLQTSMQLLNPWTGELHSHRSRNVGEFNDLFDRSTEAGRRFHEEIDFHAEAIARLDELGIPVLFRPFAEDTGGWFWWGSRTLDGPQFQKLFRYTHDYFVNEKGLDNIVWVYAPATSNKNLIRERYPGDAYVDVVGVSNYSCQPDNPDIEEIYETFQAIAPDKPFAFTEVGGEAERPSECDRYNLNLKEAIERGHMQVTYFLNWYGPDAMVFYDDADQVFSSPVVWNADDVKAHRAQN